MEIEKKKMRSRRVMKVVYPKKRFKAGERDQSLITSLDDPKHQRVVVNLDDDFASEIISNCKVPVVTYARSREHRDIADVYCERVDLSLFETAVLVSTPVGETEIVTALVGDANVSNVLASIASGLATEIPLENIAQGLDAPILRVAAWSSSTRVRSFAP